MNNKYENFYFKMVIKTIKMYNCFNDKEMKKIADMFDGYEDNEDFILPHLMFLVKPLTYSFEMNVAYINLIAKQYAKDIATFHIERLTAMGGYDTPIKRFQMLYECEKDILYSFTESLKKGELRKWIFHTIGCLDCLYDGSFYVKIYGRKTTL